MSYFPFTKYDNVFMSKFKTYFNQMSLNIYKMLIRIAALTDLSCYEAQLCLTMLLVGRPYGDVAMLRHSRLNRFATP